MKTILLSDYLKTVSDDLAKTILSLISKGNDIPIQIPEIEDFNS